jgi:uncharacterized glyoxalase superfamily protein PhnB
MQKAAARHRSFTPEGWHTVTPRVVLRDARGFIGFLASVFDARGEFQQSRPSEVLIGNSIVMVSEVGTRPSATAFLYVHVADTDATYARAMKAGARVMELPFDTPYGDRRCMIEDPWGNTWQIATHRGS